MFKVKKLALVTASSVFLTLVACGGADPSISDFNKGAAGSSGGFGNGTGDNAGGGNGLGTGGKPGAGTDLAACATQSATAEARPVYLVFMFDKSGSMKDNGKWGSAKAGSKAFFESADSKGISASLTFFPDGGNNPSCNSIDYSNPAVALSALPSTSFSTAMDQQSPNGGTPTRPAIEGAIATAQQVATGPGKDGKVAIVLVTDGIPQGCNNNSVGSVSSTVGGIAATIPTYVIGVGSELTNLDTIAQSGGTKNALIVPVGNPAQIQADFTKAVNQIKASALTCDYKIPAAPAGETFDRSKVNVQHVPTGGAGTTLAYNQTCAGGTGWKYDDANNPTRILLCDGSCDGVKAKAGKVDILFGCATQTGPVK
jgi:hypothetical protein